MPEDVYKRQAAASSTDETLSPKTSKVTAMPTEFSSRQTAMAWSRFEPAIKRAEKRRARVEVSIHFRSRLRRERKINKLRTNSSLTFRTCANRRFHAVLLDCRFGDSTAH